MTSTLIYIFLISFAPVIFNIKVINASIWKWENPLPQGNTLYAVDGFNSSDIYAVGTFSTILHYDGSRWAVLDDNSPYSLFDLRSFGSNRAIACGENGNLLILEGENFRKIPTNLNHHIYSVDLSGEEDIWILTFDFGNTFEAAIRHYNGEKWSKEYSNFSQILYMIRRLSADNIWVVGYDYTFGNEHLITLNYNGKNWVKRDFPTSLYHYSILPLTAGNIWLGGEKGSIWHFNGIGWTPQNSTIDKTINNFTSTSSLVYASADSGKILRYDWSQWVSLETGFGANLNGIKAFAENDLWAVGSGGEIIHFDGIQWKSHKSGSEEVLNCIDAINYEDAWAGGTHLLKYDNGKWIIEPSVPISNIVAIDVVSKDSIWMASSNTVLHYDGRNSQKWVFNDHSIEDLIAIKDDNVWVCGWSWDGFDGLLMHYNGTNWQRYPAGTYHRLYGITAINSTNIWAAGEMGEILKFDGTGWQRMASGEYNDFRAIYALDEGNIWAVGNAGVIQYYDGQKWTRQKPTSMDIFYDVIAFHYDDAWAVGMEGAVWHYDGKNWMKIFIPTDNDLYGICGPTSDNFRVCGWGGTILHSGGISPTPIPTPTNEPSPATPTPSPTSSSSATPTPTPLITYTPTVTSSPSSTNTPAPLNRLPILAGGYWDTNLQSKIGGYLRFIALATDPSINEIVIFYQGQPTDLRLYDDGMHSDFQADDKVYGFDAFIPGDISSGHYILELMAMGKESISTYLFPYLNVW